VGRDRGGHPCRERRLRQRHLLTQVLALSTGARSMKDDLG
jgi:hypothetical protein